MKTRRLGTGLAASLAVLTLPTLAHASPPAGRDDSRADAREDQPWIERWAPERNMGELGVYGGVLAPSATHEWFSPDRGLPDQGFRPLQPAAAGFGARVGFFPLRHFGLEAEGGLNPTATRDGAGSATLYSVRGHLVGQLGLWSITPFAVLGAGGTGVASSRDVLGNDLDPALHFGGGVKFFINRRVMLRVDVRDLVSYRQRVDRRFTSHSAEVLFGMSVTLGRDDDEGRRPRDPEPEPELVTQTVTETVVVEKPGICAPLPPLQGIQFAHDEDRILPTSTDTLDRAAEILQTHYDDARIDIIGHTDSDGSVEYNLDLSRRRAESVKRYLIARGIEAERINTRGAGPLVPVASNDSVSGRAQNRRIEFFVSHAPAQVSADAGMTRGTR